MTFSQTWQGLQARLAREPGLAAAWGLVVALTLFVLVRGKDLSWDVRNYHWYNPYALLAGRRGFDVAVAQHATFYNPMIDVPTYAGAQVLPAWLVGVSLGLVHGLNAPLLYLVAERTFDRSMDQRRRSWIAFALALAGMFGGMTLQLGGVLSQDLTVSVLVLAALFLLLRGEKQAAGADDDLLRVGVAGLLGGIAVGLKLTMVPFAIGLAAGVAALSGTGRTRTLRIAALGAGGLIGAVIFGGSWAFALWRETGNPVFPYFNELFGSPLLLAASYRDTHFLPQSVAEAWTFPLIFSFDGMRVADTPFRDIKLMLVYVLAPLALVALAARRAATDRIFSGEAVRVVYVFAAVSYVVWLNLFGIYRYVVPLEMLAPLLVAMAIDFAPVAPRHRLFATALVLALAIAAIDWQPVIGGRAPWGDRYITVEVPPIAQPNDTMVLMTGTEPSSYVIPSFPPQIPFLRIDSWLDTPGSHTRFGDAMRIRVRAHKGPLFGVFARWETERAQSAFAEYGLVLESSQCTPIATNAGEPLMWCALSRRALA